MKPYPIDHGPINEQDWTDKFRQVMSDRLSITSDEYNEIRFNLMAVVPDRRLAIHHKLKMLRTNKQIVLDALQHLVKIKEKSGKDPETQHQVTHEPEEGHNSNASSSKVTLCPLDYSTPLTIQTSPAPSTSSTDTLSDMGSPTQTWNWQTQQNSPKDVKRFVVLRIEDGNNGGDTKLSSTSSGTSSGIHAHVRTSDGNPVIATIAEEQEEKKHDLFESHTFAPKDLLALLRNLENEICMCEISLKDENDKQNKYKVKNSACIMLFL